jgi:hypothetical protein
MYGDTDSPESYYESIGSAKPEKVSLEDEIANLEDKIAGLNRLLAAKKAQKPKTLYDYDNGVFLVNYVDDPTGDKRRFVVLHNRKIYFICFLTTLNNNVNCGGNFVSLMKYEVIKELKDLNCLT